MCLTIYELSLTIIIPAKDIVAVVAFAGVVKFVKNKHISYIYTYIIYTSAN